MIDGNVLDQRIDVTFEPRYTLIQYKTKCTTDLLKVTGRGQYSNQPSVKASIKNWSTSYKNLKESILVVTLKTIKRLTNFSDTKTKKYK